MYSPIYYFLFCKVVEIFRVEKDVNNICKQRWNDEEKQNNSYNQSRATL